MKRISQKGLSIRSSLVMVLYFMTLSGCSMDESQPFITVKPSTATFDEINTCNINSCCLATRFEFTIGFEASSGTKINKILIDIKWSDGDESARETTDFNNTGSGINYNWCYKFGNEDWVQVTHRLVGDGGITSAPSMVQINKPDGAN
ncbi:hypothetical protein SYJ56_22705 [Algoriphagus sp. D3-2-R+10]|uniref:hypothetical protein n=1 Tax=Algoriphagus aurantiacus TaxID=3103948 RepID=UPI002B3B7FB2|nr:hypothetical protein [Algoriphagus sp. D3-2-R+10]MEB2778140.1 hypothetical protein [Algoriphagus sp. D3-2-R+10]